MKGERWAPEAKGPKIYSLRGDVDPARGFFSALIDKVRRPSGPLEAELHHERHGLRDLRQKGDAKV
ncbi:hypothetical protein [Methylobrevis pamukkalensis]|uniref:Uncharacterized protein n=1 Tax=Methylobrevis pamukkalensis TaxID=1439726 RepID=A0A1E3GYC1_9HYPH|nr:hypothetical protein [Methylobrevis pamukkalensis]ODN69060.1 hypothetical protein A6302_03627 [Methylobrevis pamukkalensis]